MTTQINAGEAPATMKHPLAERIEQLIDETRWTQAQKAAEAEAKAAGNQARLLALLPTIWASSGLPSLLGEGQVALTDEALSIGATAQVGETAVSVQLYIEAAFCTQENPWVGLEVKSRSHCWGKNYLARAGDGVFQDQTEVVVKQALKIVEWTREARLVAENLLERAQEIAYAWAVWDDACRWHAGKLTRALFEPVEMWRLTRPVRGEEAEEELIVLEAPQDVAAGLAGGKPALVTVVGSFGDVVEKWVFGVESMQALPERAATIEQELPYYRTFRVGRYYVNVPVTVPMTAPEVVELMELASNKKRLSDVLGVEDPSGRWETARKELNWGFYANEDEHEQWVHESYWPKQLAKMTVEEIVAAWGPQMSARGRGADVWGG